MDRTNPWSWRVFHAAASRRRNAGARRLLLTVRQRPAHARRPPAEPTPTVLGHEIVGRIEAFGPDAPRLDSPRATLAIGDRITWSVAANCRRCFFCAEGLPQKCERLFKYGHQARPRGRATVQRRAGGCDSVAARHRLSASAGRTGRPFGRSSKLHRYRHRSAMLHAGGDVAGRTVLILGAGMLGLTACAMARAAGAAAVLVSDPDAPRGVNGLQLLELPPGFLPRVQNWPPPLAVVPMWFSNWPAFAKRCRRR